jgi:diaminohydroxyphosphoribosylaminopyrimidine deaminase/5-amino-6-(5-phosphoribosylamino)uracil reductase
MTQINQQKKDRKFINLAINLAQKTLQKTAPNPRVACVIVKDDNILSTATTASGGRPHAEILAINKINNLEDLDGATIYITLEPCCSYDGKISKSCSDEIIKNKFARVVIACLDFNRNVRAQSVEKLKSAGIEVLVLNDDFKIHQEFAKTQNSALPFITLKIATSLDGKIATANFTSKWITNEKSRQYAHFLRANCDAILIGKNTLIKDNPRLDCRIDGLEEYSAKKVIISQSLDFVNQLSDYEISKNNSEIIILTGMSNERKIFKENLSPNSSLKIIFCEEFIDKNNCKKIKFSSAMSNLIQENINSVLIEGGSQIITQFLQEDLIDKIIWARSNKIIGGDGIPAIGNMYLTDISKSLQNFQRLETLDFESDIIEILQKK